MSTLRALSISNMNQVGYQSVDFVVEHFPHMEELELAGQSQLDDYQLGNNQVHQGFRFDDGVFALVAKLKSLRYLSLSGNPAITSAGLAKLRELSLLEELDLSGCSNLSDDLGGALRQCPSLKTLRIGWTFHYSRVKQEYLGPMLGAKTWSALAGMERLQLLDVTRSPQLDGAGLLLLAKSPKLQYLMLEGNRALSETDSVAAIRIKTLRLIDLRGTTRHKALAVEIEKTQSPLTLVVNID